MIDIAVIFGANRTQAEQEMTDVLKFEIELAKVDVKLFERKILHKNIFDEFLRLDSIHL